MRKLASVVEIETCEPIENSDRLSVATMVGKGWRVVTGRGEFKPGDVAVYFEIDAALDPADTRYSFLKDRCLRKFVSKSGNVLKEVLRIKTAKLRGVVSQGLLMPLSSFVGPDKEIQATDEPATPENCVADDGSTPSADDLAGLMVSTLSCKLEDGTSVIVEPGTDLTEVLHVEHYDEIAEALRPTMGGNPIAADAMGKFPTDYIPKTDEERCLLSGTIVSTDKGLLKIDDLNDFVGTVRALSVGEDGEVELNTVIGFSKGEPSENWLKITLEDGTELTCTTNHRVFSADKNAFVEASELKAGESLKVGG